jgi:ElaB/YqjD/DUF883 family membrane-anchored ribosome-binding protein
MTEYNSQEPAVKFADGAMTKTQHAADAANAFLKSGVDSMLHTTNQLRDGARDAADRTTHFIREEPIKSVLIAAATGAVLMALVGLVRRSPART